MFTMINSRREISGKTFTEASKSSWGSFEINISSESTCDQ